MLEAKRTFNWKTDTYGKMEYYENKDDSFTDLETEYPDIVFDDTSNVAFSREPTVHVLDFAGLTDGIKQTLRDRLSMVYDGDDGQALFTSQTWRRLFEVRAPVVREFMLEFFSTYRMGDIEIGLDVADTLYFQLGGARRRMT
ncbi:hypothetical protein Tco_0646945 [Tanacetum coccineum]